MASYPDVTRAEINARETTGMTPRPLTKKPKGENDDLNISSLLQGFYRPDFSLPRTNRDRVPELDELVMQDERDDLAKSADVDIIKRGVITREQHTSTPSDVPVRPPGPDVPVPEGLMLWSRRGCHRMRPPAASRCGGAAGTPCQLAPLGRGIVARGRRANRG
eukprot:732248-Pyramimonas_sp.AAC.1